MIRRHPWISAGIGLGILVPAAAWAVFIEAWWAYQGRQSWGRP